MSTFDVFSQTGAAIIAPFTHIVGIGQSLAPDLRNTVLAGLTIQLMWYGYETIRGKGSSYIFLDVFAMSLRVGLVIAIGLTAYTTNVVGLINSLIGQLSTFFGSAGVVNGSGVSAGINPGLAALDSACQTALDTMSKIWDIATGTNGHTPSHITFNLSNSSPADFSGVMMISQGLVMLIAFGIYACIAGFELLYIQISLLIFYAIGPVFIACYAFKSTENFFNTWLSGVLKYAMTAIVIAMVIGLGNSILINYANKIATNLNFLDFISLGISSLLAAAMLVLLILRVPQLAADIIGGVAVQSAASTVAAGYAKIKAARANKANQRVAAERHAQLVGALGGRAGGGSTSANNSISKSMDNFSKGGTGTINGSRPSGTPMQSMLSK